MRWLGLVPKKSGSAEPDESPVDWDQLCASLRKRLSWAEIRTLTIHQLIHELGGGHVAVSEADSRREGAAKVFDKLRETHGLSMDELRASDIDTLRGWAIEQTGKPVDPGMFRDLFLQYVNT